MLLVLNLQWTLKINENFILIVTGEEMLFILYSLNKNVYRMKMSLERQYKE